jgi:hypothetical protein
MKKIWAQIAFGEVNYEVSITPLFNEILNEVNYLIKCGQSLFLMAWDNSENPEFRIQGAAPYIAHDLREQLAVIIEHNDA